MSTALFAYSRRGCGTARQVLNALGEAASLYAPARLAEPPFAPIPRPSQAFYGEVFGRSDVLIFVGSCGIAVREIAPHVHSKQTDPAVLVIDELGTYVIPVLSGHIGGANALARKLAAALNAIPVLTTATDINHRFSVDTWAAENGFGLSRMSAAKAVSAAILERDVPLCCDFPLSGALPAGLVPGREGPVGICVSCALAEPFADTLRVIPPVLHLGIGCRRGTPAAAIEQAVAAVLAEHQLERRAIRCACSIDLKSNEEGLLAFCAENGWPIRFYSAQQLAAVPGEFTPSAFVAGVTGVDNVCERAALAGADRLLVRKTIHSGVTVALAQENLEVSFG